MLGLGWLPWSSTLVVRWLSQPSMLVVATINPAAAGTGGGGHGWGGRQWRWVYGFSAQACRHVCRERWCGGKPAWTQVSTVRSSPSEGRGQRQPTTNTKVTAIMRDVGPQNYGEFNELLFCNKAVLWAVDENGWALLACRSVWMQWKGW